MAFISPCPGDNGSGQKYTAGVDFPSFHLSPAEAQTLLKQLNLTFLSLEASAWGRKNGSIIILAVG